MDIRGSINIIFVEDNACWICNSKEKKLTQHHVLPMHLKPVKNVTVPVCEKCHTNLNVIDKKAMFGMVYMTLKLHKTIKQKLNALLSNLNKI